MKSIVIDIEKCVGCGRCTEICPTSFSLNSEGKSEVINENDIECAKKASDECPQGAITVDDNNINLDNLDI